MKIAFDKVWIPIDKHGKPWMGMLTDAKKPTCDLEGYEWHHFAITEIISK